MCPITRPSLLSLKSLCPCALREGAALHSARLCSPERQVGHLPSSGTPSGVYHEGAALHLRVLDVLVVVEVLESRAPRASACKPWKGVKITAGGERSVTPGNLGTRQRVPRELGSPREASRLSGISGASGVSGISGLFNLRHTLHISAAPLLR